MNDDLDFFRGISWGGGGGGFDINLDKIES